ncbi:MAG: Sua5/YciO/YrdC/YwlC family protein [Flavobacterium sp.]|nr:Sua5/YciO/YrdC/YwlC family protein [Flavobacterium sp.]
MEPIGVIYLSERTKNGSVNTKSTAQIKSVLELPSPEFGFIMLPSDTGYSLATVATHPDIYTYINPILNRNSVQISIAVSNEEMLKKFITSNPIATALLGEFSPGPITIVCKKETNIPSNYTEEVIKSYDETIGVRIPDSLIEREISTIVGYPITTVAVRDNNNTIVQNFNDAIAIVKKGISKLYKEKQKKITWIAIEGGDFYKNHSTVVKINDNKSVTILREGQITKEQIDELVTQITNKK